MDDRLNFNEIEIGMRVRDHDGDIGIVTQIEDINNIYVKYDNGGFGYICLEAGCCSNALYKITQ